MKLNRICSGVFPKPQQFAKVMEDGDVDSRSPPRRQFEVHVQRHGGGRTGNGEGNDKRKRKGKDRQGGSITEGGQEGVVPECLKRIGPEELNFGGNVS